MKPHPSLPIWLTKMQWVCQHHQEHKNRDKGRKETRMDPSSWQCIADFGKNSSQDLNIGCLQQLAEEIPVKLQGGRHGNHAMTCVHHEANMTRPDCRRPGTGRPRGTLQVCRGPVHAQTQLHTVIMGCATGPGSQTTTQGSQGDHLHMTSYIGQCSPQGNIEGYLLCGAGPRDRRLRGLWRV